MKYKKKQQKKTGKTWNYLKKGKNTPHTSDTTDEVKHIKIWIDWPVSLFKNQYVMASMPTKHNVKLPWNFSATNHGKRPIDGVGATLKWQAMEKVQTRKCIIDKAKELFNAVQRSNIKVKMINSAELKKYTKDYLKKITWQCNLEPTDNGYVTKRYYSFIINESTTIEVEENNKEVKIQAKATCWYAYYLEKYQY